MKVQLNWKESSYSKLPELHIAASEIVSDETFEQMQAHPLWDHDVIQKLNFCAGRWNAMPCGLLSRTF